MNQLVRETGCHEVEAAAALEMTNGVLAKAKFHIENELRFRRAKFAALETVWAEYSSGEETDYDGTIAFLTDLGVDFENEVLLAVAYELGATQVGVFTRQQWIDGLARLGCTSVAAMRPQVAKMAARLESDKHYFTTVYRFTFRYNLEPGHRLLDSETAQGYWRLLLLRRFPTTELWLQFFTQKVSRDVWNMYLEFCQYYLGDPALERYDENASWPVAIDEYVDWLRENGHATPQPSV